MKLFKILIILGLLIYGLLAWVDYSWKSSMKRSYEKTISEEFYEKRKIAIIQRYNTDNKVYSISSDALSYKCFEFEKGFDEFVRNGDFLSKKKGKLLITITKSNGQKRDFYFRIVHCNYDEESIKSDVYYE